MRGNKFSAVTLEMAAKLTPSRAAVVIFYSTCVPVLCLYHNTHNSGERASNCPFRSDGTWDRIQAADANINFLTPLGDVVSKYVSEDMTYVVRSTTVCRARLQRGVQRVYRSSR